MTTPFTAFNAVVPCKVPLPAARAAVIVVLLSLFLKFPNWSSIRTWGCGEKTTPAVAVEGGCVKMVSLLAAAGLTITLPEVTPANKPLLKSIEMVSALL